MSSTVAQVYQWRAKVRSLPIPDHVHGTRHGYNAYGCRCEGCTKANADYSRKKQRQYRERDRAAEIHMMNEHEADRQARGRM